MMIKNVCYASKNSSPLSSKSTVQRSPKSYVSQLLHIELLLHRSYRILESQRRMFANAHNKIISLHKSTERIEFKKLHLSIGQFLCVLCLPEKTSISDKNPIALIYRPIRPQRQWRLSHSRDQRVRLMVMMSWCDVPVFHRWHPDFDK